MIRVFIRPFCAFLCFFVAIPLVGAAEPPKSVKITFDDHVLPILRDKCTACHGQDKKASGLQLHTYTKVIEGGSGGVMVKAGDPDGSPLFLHMAHKAEPFMPPKSPKLEKEAEVIRQWIAAGALENSGSKAIATKPKVDIGLTSVVRGKPDGPPPMPPANLPLDPVVKASRPNAITALASSPWAPLVAVAGAKQVLLYNSDTLDLVGVLPFPEGTVNVLKFSRNASLLLAAGGRGGKSGRVVVWSVTIGQRVIEVGDENDCVLAADISPDQTQIALGGPSKVIRIYSTRDLKLLHEIRKHTDWVTSLEYSPDGVLLATGDRNGGLFVWEAFTGREYFSLRGHTACITDISWRADGNVCASCSEDTTVRLWEMENGGQIRNWGAHGGGCQAVRYTRDGRLVTCGRDRTVKTWDGNGGAQRTFDALPDVAMRCTFSHDGARVIGGDWTGQLPVWTAADGKRVGQLDANPPTVAERLDLAIKEVATAQAEHDKLGAAATASQTALQAANTELARQQKVVTDSQGAAKAAADALPKAKAAADQAKAALAPATGEVKAKEVLTQALTEAAAKVKDAAAKSNNDKALVAAATRAQELANQANTELAAVRKTLADLTTASQNADKALAAAQQMVPTTAAAAAAAPKAVEAQQAAVKNATAKAAADQSAVTASAATLAAVKGRVEKLRAAQSVVKQPGK
jgi:hypothetical protein